MFRLLKLDVSSALVALVLVFAAQSASAQQFGFSYGRRGHHNSVGFGFSTGYSYAPSYVVTRAYVPGHYETVYRQVWVEGCRRQVWVSAVYTTVCDPCGRSTRVCTTPGYWTWVQDPGHFETRAESVWVVGCYR